ncbi:unnamed protein product [Blepharisma stoltei]|uniref:TmcB/TmcC TPR repeats domain-containing protein n=1 Tax=Blepharisma stoltei TaxID=1481888 RepID=A0AAU9JPN8_9CILI|nr:unnamed protein product [Blepharisma stoltei]
MFDKKKDDLLEDIESSNAIAQEISSDGLKLSILKFLEKVFKVKYHNKMNYRNQLIFEITTNIVIALQMLSLIWYPDMNIKQWNKYNSLWNFVRYFNLISICSEIDAIVLGFYGIISLILFCIASFIFVAVLGYFKKEAPSIITALTQQIISFISTIAYIPGLLFFSMIFKYSSFGYTEIKEFHGNKSVSQLDYGFIGAALGIIFDFLLILLAISHELLTADLRHTFASKNIRARSHSTIDVETLLFYPIQVFLYLFVGNSSTVYYQLSLFIIGGLFTIHILYYLPYYTPVGNSIESSRMSMFTITIIFFFIGYALDDAGVFALLGVCLQIFIAGGTTIIAYSSYNKAHKRKNEIATQYDFELKIRHLLMNKSTDNRKKVIDSFTYFSKQKKFIRSKLFVIWETYYCIFILKDERLARIKFSKIINYKSSPEAWIQELKIIKWFEDNKSNVFAETNFLEYLIELDKVKTQDKSMCFMLLKLWNEITAHKPRINSLRKYVAKVAENISYAKTSYKNLIGIHKHAYAFEIYGTFLQDIAGDYEEGGIILRRMDGHKDHDLMIGDEKRLSTFRDRYGIMLISANEGTFGEITYLNEKAAQLLSAPSIEALGTPFSNYIPENYSGVHDSYMKQFAESCIHPEVGKPNDFFLQNERGYLVECQMIIRYTAFSSSSFFLVSMRPKNTTRQMAYLTETGMIINYTHSFPSHLNYENRSLRSQSITQLIPSIKMTEMKPYEPYLTHIRTKEVGFVHVIKQLKRSLIHLLLLIHDEKEIKIWKEGLDQEQLDYFNKDIDNSDIINPAYTVLNATETVFYYGSHYSEKRLSYIRKSFDENEKDEEETDGKNQTLEVTTIEEKMGKDLDDDEKVNTDGYQPNSPTINMHHHIKKVIEDASRKIKIFQWVLFATVIAVICTNVGIVAYMYEEINHTGSLKTFENLGEIAYNLGVTANFASLLEFGMVTGQSNVAENKERLTNSIEELRSLENTILDDYSSWKYCSYSEIVKDPIIPTWSFEFGPQISHLNLYDQVEKFIYHGQNMLSNINQNISYMDDFKFLFINSLGFTYHYTYYSLDGLISCEHDRITNEGVIVTGLIFFGLGFLTLCILILSYFAFATSKKSDIFWNAIKKSSHLAYHALMGACIDRLTTVHGITYLSEENNVNNFKKNDSGEVISRTYWRYIWRLIILLIFSSIFYLITGFWLYGDCQTYMLHRSELLVNFIKRRVELSRMSLFGRELSDPLMSHRFPESYSFDDSNEEFSRANKTFWDGLEQLKEYSLKELMSNELKVRIFENIDTDNELLQYGTYLASQIVACDVNSITQSYRFGSFDVKNEINQNVLDVNDEVGTDWQMANNDSKDKIYNQLYIIIYFTLSYSIASFFLFIAFYMPFLSEEKKFLLKVQIISSIIPNNIKNPKQSI